MTLCDQWEWGGPSKADPGGSGPRWAAQLSPCDVSGCSRLPMTRFPHCHHHGWLEAVPSTGGWGGLGIGGRMLGGPAPPSRPSVRPAGPLQAVTAQQWPGEGLPSLSRMDSSGTDADERNAPPRAPPARLCLRPAPPPAADSAPGAEPRRPSPATEPRPRPARSSRGPRGAALQPSPGSVSPSVAWVRPLRAEGGLCGQRRRGARRPFPGVLGRPSAQARHRPFVREMRGGRENGSARRLKGAAANTVDPRPRPSNPGLRPSLGGALRAGPGLTPRPRRRGGLPGEGRRGFRGT